MQDSTFLTLFIAIPTLLSALLARFYLSITRELDSKGWLRKLRAFTYAIPVAVLAGFTVLTLLLLFYESEYLRDVFLPIFGCTASLLVFQLIQALALFVFRSTRPRALASIEFRVLCEIAKLAGFLAVCTAKVVIGVIRLSARSSNNDGREIWDTMGPYSHNRYEGYFKRAERKFGKPFGDHF